MARPRLGEQERRTHGRRAGDGGRGGRAAGAGAGGAALDGSLPAPPGAGAAGADGAVERRLGAAELRELNRIGVNLNQMARALNAGAVSSPAETQEAVERVGELVAKLLAGERE